MPELVDPRDTAGIVIAKDHGPEGGLGEAVLSALAERGATCPVRHLAVRDMPRSGVADELLAAAASTPAPTLTRLVSCARRNPPQP